MSTGRTILIGLALVVAGFGAGQIPGCAADFIFLRRARAYNDFVTQQNAATIAAQQAQGVQRVSPGKVEPAQTSPPPPPEQK